MKVKLIKIFLIVVLVPIFLFLFAREVNAGCFFVTSWPDPACPGKPTTCSLNGGVPVKCEKCVGTWWAWYACTTCDDCYGGEEGGTPDTVKPQCGVRIEPYVASGNLVQNPRFETGNASWDLSGMEIDDYFDDIWRIWWRHSGSWGLRGGDSYSTTTQHIPVKQGAIYKLSLWAKAVTRAWENGTHWCRGNASILIDGGGSGGIHGAQIVRGPLPSASNPLRDSGWKYWEATIYAHDNTLTLTLVSDNFKKYLADGCWWTAGGKAAFDDITLQKIEGAESAPGQDVVNLRIGVWDERIISGRRIRNDDSNWPDDLTGWEGFSYEASGNEISWPLSGTGTVYVQIRDGGGNISNACSDTITVIPPTGTIRGTVYDIANAGASCPLSGDGVSGGSVKAASTSNTYGPIGANPNYTFSDIVADDQYVVTMTTIPEDYMNPYYCDGSLPGQLGGITVDLSADETEVVDIGLTRLADPWFQTKEGDVHGQSISVSVPEDKYFCEAGDGGTPGVVSHGTGTPDFSPGSVSETGWLANTEFSRKYYDYFYQLLGSPTEEFDGNLPSESGVYYTKNPLTVDGWSVPGDRKLIILVDSNANINSNVTVTEGGFLAIIASNHINIADGVDLVEGVYLTDGHFSTGEGSLAFTGKGMFIANSFKSDRDLGDANESTPAIKFIYRPDLWLNAPAELLVPSYTWQELAP